MTMKTTSRRWFAALALGCVTAFAAPLTAFAAPGGTAGPSSSDAPYVVRSVPGVTLTSILTAGDSVGGYQMVGVPDGLGAYDNGDGTFTLLMNHELTPAQGAVRAHGAAGAFISKWVIKKSTLAVLSGADLIQTVYLFDGTRYQATPAVAFNRFCSADLPAAGAFFNPATGNGYDGRIFMNGEETAGGRAFGHVVETGDSYQLADFGAASWENVLANPAAGDKTVVAGLSDTGGGAVYVYTGDKKSTGNPVERAGLTGGIRYGVSVAGFPLENPNAAWTGDARFTLTTDAAATTGWARPEDGAWDPKNPNDFYFVTTASFTEPSRMWRLRFDDVANPAAGGTVSLVLQGAAGGAAGPNMMDNVTVNDRGQVLVQEDPGSNAYVSGIFQVDTRTGDFRRIAQHDPNRFLTGGSRFDTIDEESSGIIAVPFLGEGAYLFDVQDHAPSSDPKIVQKGQLLLMHVPPGQPIRKK
jgi:hypothetical protein